MTTTLPQLLRHSASAHPDGIAVDDPERGVEVTYRELHSRAEKLSEYMIRHGVRPGDRVGIYAPKSVGTVAALLGALYSRAAYVPVDCSAPPARNAGIFADSSIRLAVVAESLLEGLRNAWDGTALDVLQPLGDDLVLVRGVDAEGDSATDPDGEATPADVAYILYTSGSTGKPKGVVHTHRSALSFIDWCSETFEPTAGDRFSSHAPFHFDLSILDLYVPLKHGATIVLIGEDVGKQPLRLAPGIADSRITVWYSTPSILRMLAEYGRLDRLEFPSLRTVLFAGEVFPVKHLRALKRIWSAPRYFNLYGPTETNVCTYYEIPDEIPVDRTEPFPIGFTCSGDRAIVADDSGREVKKGEEGELLVTGGSVMRDYWNLPERTAQAFFVDAEGTTWYRTGDVVRESPTDGYVFVGRRDRMVKRRGYRVELGEIEAALHLHPLVIEAAVTAVPDEENGVAIKAFLSLSSKNRPSLVEMKRFCIEHLPAYMVPDKFYFPESLPKTSTDKIDYQRLLTIA
ncbi:MAG TPA: amino acid adenylation domain-containing protein [Gemmatimonadaceae bacterium]|nr:amino acid adenylation domain-containing protein [Gemmatimonadaceae bacterium]